MILAAADVVRGRSSSGDCCFTPWTMTLAAGYEKSRTGDDYRFSRAGPRFGARRSSPMASAADFTPNSTARRDDTWSLPAAVSCFCCRSSASSSTSLVAKRQIPPPCVRYTGTNVPARRSCRTRSGTTPRRFATSADVRRGSSSGKKCSGGLCIVQILRTSCTGVGLFASTRQ